MRKTGSRATMGKIASLLMVLTLIWISGDLIAGERHGATLVVEKKDGAQERGELISVKPSSILLLGSSSGTDVSIDVPDIKTIRIVNKSRALSGLGWGALAGGGVGALLGFASGNDNTGWFSSAGSKAFFLGVGFGVVGGVIGLLIGAGAGADETIQMEGKDATEVQAALNGLKQKARIPNFR